MMRTEKIRHFLFDRRAASAVEFALVMPLFLVLVFGIIIYGSYLVVVHGVQQLTAEAARASIAGLTDTERSALASANIASNVNAYPVLTASALKMQSASTDPLTSTFSVTVRYDASDLFVFSLPSLLPAPNPIIVRTASIRRGGF